MRKSPFLQACFVIAERLLFLVPQATTILLITRLLGSEFFGKYALVLTWATLFQLVANFGISECLAREIGRSQELGSRYLRHGLYLGGAFSLVAMIIMVIVALVANYPADVTAAILLATGTLPPANIVATCRGVLLANQRVQYMMWVGLAESLILLPLNIYLILTEAGLLPLVGTIVLAKWVTGLLALWLVHRFVASVIGPLERAVLGQLWQTVLPFGVSSLIVFPSVRFDILLLSKLATLETVGLYTAASKLMEFLFVLPMTFFMVMLPPVALDLSGRGEQKTGRLQQSLSWYFTFVIPLGIGMIGFAEPIVILLYGRTFTNATLLLQILMIAFLLLTLDVPLAMVCKAAGFQRTELGFVVISTSVNLIMNVLLIPFLGAVGAGLAVVFSVLVGLILRWGFVSRSIMQVNWLVFIKAPVVTALLLLAICIMLASRIPWPILASGYVVGYSVYVLSQFRYINNR